VMSILPTLLSSNLLSCVLHHVPSDIPFKGLTFGLNSLKGRFYVAKKGKYRHNNIRSFNSAWRRSQDTCMVLSKM
jgi:hypothetical protein